ncbi:TlpA disulfide reductase family protein [Alteromonas sp. ASW11-36]|uniref:TlpA disulfide reductase family protein n=1 Tax=Alteromonas arenosi TaxID=3055817 RepID=A0ABT7T2K9_9ALTE|nr:TlpA disulfide reductase family protein [Alteromonas sp. ASW11-36]MDM7862022.1 TlpA disulfide reductase family protein [Alteromonas sp. ASW11-36]
MQPKYNIFTDFPKLAMLLALLLVLTTLTTETQANTASSEAPDFTLPSRDGDNRRLAEERGNIVLVNFWASWCGPCREELPEMEALQQKYEDMGFTVLAVNVDDKPEKADVLLDDIEVTFPVLFDTQGEVSELYDVSAMPTTVIVDRNGIARLTHKGYTAGDEKKYEKAIKILMRE